MVGRASLIAQTSRIGTVKTEFMPTSFQGSANAFTASLSSEPILGAAALVVIYTVIRQPLVYSIVSGLMLSQVLTLRVWMSSNPRISVDAP